MADIIYRPRGAALEYCELSMNHYKCCSHGCVYCYASGCLFMTPEAFRTNLVMAKDWKERITLNTAKLQSNGITGPVHLSFLSDPYQPIEREMRATRYVLEMFHQHGIHSQILTKAGPWGLSRDADLLVRTHANWGATLTTDNDKESLEWEPGAALPGDRIAALEKAHGLGLKTWVSLEPVINPAAVFRLIDATHCFVTVFKVGKLNRHRHAATIDWPKFRADVVAKLESVGANYTLKKALIEA
jgi:DNA repair photolyase